jgi:acyl-CoA thioester hydrolase
MRIRTRVQIRFNDVDMARHVHNAVYLSYFELARMDYLRQFIPEGNDWNTQGLILARNEVDYRSPVHLGDIVEVEAWCSNIGDKSFDLSYALFVVTGDARKLCTQGRSVMVCFHYGRKASVPLPGEWRTALARMAENDA